jgi:hypothetical protein
LENIVSLSNIYTKSLNDFFEKIIDYLTKVSPTSFNEVDKLFIYFVDVINFSNSDKKKEIFIIFFPKLTEK